MEKITNNKRHNMKILTFILALFLVYAVVLFVACVLAGANGKDNDELK